MKRIVAVLTLLLLAGCAEFRPYASVGLSYAVPSRTNRMLHSDRPWQCEQPEFDGEVGAEHKSGIRVGAYHRSMLLCGTFDDRPELYSNGVRVSADFGGWKDFGWWE